ncbi:LOW QUALITY PROTEIN: protein phosphatase 1 regulatory subunit 36 [Cariama cristata]
MEDRDLTQQEETRGRKDVNDWMMIKVTPGVGYRKDDTNTLEFASYNPAAKENLKEGKNIHFQEMLDKTLKSIFQDDWSTTLPERRLADKEGKLHRLSKWLQHEYMTLDDVKCENEKLDEFLMALLFHLSFYLEKIALEKKCRSLILTMIFLEKKEMDNVLVKLVVARIHLAKVYCNLLLLGGMAQQCLMPTGKRKTSLQKDWSFFEGFYNFCSYVAWLVFRWKHFQVPCRVGITGAHCSELKSFMSMPDGTMEEEEEEEEQEQGRIRSVFSILTNYLSLPPLRSP